MGADYAAHSVSRAGLEVASGSKPLPVERTLSNKDREPDDDVIVLPNGRLRSASRAEIEAIPEWKRAFAHCRKDWRYYQIVHDTIVQGFD